MSPSKHRFPFIRAIYLFIGISIIYACKESPKVIESQVVQEVLQDQKATEILEDDLLTVTNEDIHIIDNAPDRSSWQNPNLVIERMGNIEGKIIADIGASVGYFAFRLVLSGARVIAVELDESMVQLMNSFAITNLTKEQSERFRTHIALPDDPLLKENEVDQVIIMNTITLIENKKSYLTKLRQCLKPDGRLMIMDFKMKRLPDQFPSKEDRIYADILEELLYELGYDQVIIDDSTLDYQYIIFANNAK